MLEEINHKRRRFIGNAALAVAATQLGFLGSASAQQRNPASTDVPAVKPGTHTSFASIKQIEAGLLNVGYAEDGPATGEPVILLHGWPYAIYSFVDVSPSLALIGERGQQTSWQRSGLNAARGLFP